MAIILPLLTRCDQQRKTDEKLANISMIVQKLWEADSARKWQAALDSAVAAKEEEQHQLGNHTVNTPGIVKEATKEIAVKEKLNPVVPGDEQKSMKAVRSYIPMLKRSISGK